MKNSMMIRAIKLFVILLSTTLLSCEKNSVDTEQRFVPTDVSVKVRAGYEIHKVFEFINQFEHEVEHISSLVYTSDLRSDSLQYVLDYLNAKAYSHGKASWDITGYLQFQTKKITVFPRLFNMNNPNYQTDWLETMEILHLNEDVESGNNGTIIYFHVPAGAEKEWVKVFKEYEFVEWAELNTLYDKDPLE